MSNVRHAMPCHTMNGLIALLGSGEYLPVTNDTDRYLLANCGADERTPRVVCLPTAPKPTTRT